MSAPNAAQLERLLEFLEENEDLARGHMRTVEGRLRSQALWADITEALNAIEGGCVKNVRQWQKVSGAFYLGTESFVSFLFLFPALLFIHKQTITLDLTASRFFNTYEADSI